MKGEVLGEERLESEVGRLVSGCRIQKVDSKKHNEKDDQLIFAKLIIKAGESDQSWRRVLR